MVIKKMKYNCWKALKDAAQKYASMGFIVECRGWDDISANILTIYDGDFEDKEGDNG